MKTVHVLQLSSKGSIHEVTFDPLFCRQQIELQIFLSSDFFSDQLNRKLASKKEVKRSVKQATDKFLSLLGPIMRIAICYRIYTFVPSHA